MKFSLWISSETADLVTFTTEQKISGHFCAVSKVCLIASNPLSLVLSLFVFKRIFLRESHSKSKEMRNRIKSRESEMGKLSKFLVILKQR